MKRLMLLCISVTWPIMGMSDLTLFSTASRSVAAIDVRQRSLCPYVFGYPIQERFHHAFACAGPVFTGVALAALNNLLKGEPLDAMTNSAALLVCLPPACIIMRSLYNVTKDIHPGN